MFTPLSRETAQRKNRTTGEFFVNIFELRKQRDFALSKADSLVKAAEGANRQLTDAESTEVDASLAAVKALAPRIAELEKRNSITQMFSKVNGNSVLLIDGGRRYSATKPVTLSHEYADDFFQFCASGGKKQGAALSEGLDPFGGGFVIPTTAKSAALYEGNNSAGGYAVPIVVDDQIVPLAPQEMAVRQLATVIPTTSDIKIPTKSTFGSATAKSELSSFTESEPTLSQFTLSAFMAGVLQEISWELAQDVPAFQAFAVDDMVLDQQMYEENLFINGTGSGQAQGLIGNVGSGYGPQEPDTNSNNVSIAGLLNLQGTLNAVYQRNASWLMNRATSIIVRKAQMQSNLFYPAYTRDADGTDRLFGFPVSFAQSMPAATRGNTPILFGDFKRGYIIGDRGGSGINVKVLDQPLATQGIIQLLAYRRTDGRVRRSEAIQSYQISAS
jgi:HK97 family phage major capsid protein